jgi:hypothetical protein
MRLIVLILALFAPIGVMSVSPDVGEVNCCPTHWGSLYPGADQTELCNGTIN